MDKHTPLPWEQGNAGNGQITVHDMTYLNRHIAYMPMDSMPEGEQEANAAFIVRACNSHYDLIRQRDELLEALNSCLLYFQEQKDGTRAGTHPKELFDLVDGVIKRIEQSRKGEE